MGYFTEKKWPCLLLAVFFVVTGAFSFSAAGILYCEAEENADLLSAAEQVSENYFASLTLCLAESAVSTGDDSRYLFSSPRAETVRLFMSDGRNSTGSYHSSSPSIALEYRIPIIKNSTDRKILI